MFGITRSLFLTSALLFCYVLSLEEGFTSFAVVKGYVISLRKSTLLKNVTDFDQCQLKCRFAKDCIAVLQFAPNESCYLFPYRSLRAINKTTEDNKNARVAIRVLSMTCKVDNKVALDNKIYPKNLTHTDLNQYNIRKVKEGHTIDYLNYEVDCGWFEDGLTEDSCEPQCLTRMVRTQAKSGIRYGTLYQWTPLPVNVSGMKTYKDCTYWCHANPECALTTWVDYDTSFVCYYVSYNYSWAPFWNVPDPKVGGVFKVETDETTCKLPNNELINGKTYTTRNASKVTNYYINYTQNYYVVAFQNTTDCFTNWTAVGSPDHCIMAFVPQQEMGYLRWIIEYCQAYGGTVAPLTYENKALLNQQGIEVAATIYPARGTTLIGINVTENSIDYYDKSYVADGNSPTNFWASGYPKDRSTNHCTFMKYSKTEAPVELINAPCADNEKWVVDEFSCVTKRFSDLQKLAWRK